ncbi:HNH endonuclease [Pseudorhodoplanes sp.]|uniref:HNH endonuclease n=1 Tax=Pseudorhodoplanes sp. TaxID=1934341 RepID=UPI003D1479ED
MARNVWSRDALLVALDLYFRSDRKLPSPDAIEALSQLLHRIGEPRNFNAVSMKLGNFQALDPSYTASGRVGLPRGGKEDRAVWNEYAGEPNQLRSLAAAITASIDTLPATGQSEDFDGVEAPEGRLLTRLHVYRERDRSLRRKKILSIVGKGKSLSCEACDFDFEKRYGPRGSGFIEIHHTLPLQALVDERITKLSELALVCANCHRMIHAKRPWLTINELRAHIQRH